MSYYGDFAPGSTVEGYFNTRDTDGVPITLAGTPALRVYKGSSTTEDDSGITLTVDFDSCTGLHYWAVDTSTDGTFYAAGANFAVVLTAGTVDSVSVVGVVVGEFSLNNRSALRPTTAGRTLTIESDGMAHADVKEIEGAGALASINAQADAAIETYHLDHLLAATYDPASKPGAADALLNELVENDGGVSRFTANALEQGPSGSGVSEATLVKYVSLLVRSDAAATTDLATELGNINQDYGSGAGDYAATTESQEALRDRGDSAWITATGFSTLDAAGVRTAVGLASANLDTQLADIPTVSEFNARSLTAASYATATNQTTIITHLTDIKGATFDGSTDSIEAIRNRGDSAWVTATSVTVSDKTGFKLASDGLDSVVVETDLNARQAMSVIASAVGGVLAGAGTTAITIAAAGVPATNRITATVDSSGNRTVVTLDPPA